MNTGSLSKLLLQMTDSVIPNTTHTLINTTMLFIQDILVMYAASKH